MSDAKEDVPLGELLGTLARDTGALMRQELRLASTEMSLKAKHYLRNAALVGVGGALGLAGLLALMAALVAALATRLPLWLSALIVGVVVILAASMLIVKGLSALRRIDPVPHQTLGTLAEDVTWAKEQIR